MQVKSKLRAALTLVLLGGCLFPAIAVAKPGDLDPSFGRGGKVAPYLGHPTSGRAVVVQPDRRIVVAAASGVVRYFPNGHLDRSFGDGDGQVLTSGVDSAPALDIALQFDRKIVVVGGQTIERLNSDGSLDRSFGAGDGVVTDNRLSIAAVALTPDGKVVVGGSTGEGFGVARFTDSGQPDRSFGTDGLAITNGSGAPRGSNLDSVKDLLVQPDGSIVAAGVFGYELTPCFHGCTASRRLAVVRYTADGDLDPSFSSNGIFTTRTGEASSIASRTGSRFVVAWQTAPPGFRLIGLTVAGRLDRSFGDRDGVATTHFGRFGTASAVACQRNGRIVAVGIAKLADRAAFGITRSRPNGELDREFGDRGRVITPIGDLGTAQGVAFDHGQIVVVGYTHNFPPPPGRYRVALARYFGGTGG